MITCVLSFQSLDDLSNSCHDENMHLHAFISDTGTHTHTHTHYTHFVSIIAIESKGVRWFI